MKTYNETVHENIKRSKCECGKQFASKKGLQRHKSTVHAKVKSVFQCHICGLKYSRKDKLKTRQDKHYVKNNTRGNVEENLKTVHEKKNRFACECGKNFQPKELYSVMKIQDMLKSKKLSNVSFVISHFIEKTS